MAISTDRAIYNPGETVTLAMRLCNETAEVVSADLMEKRPVWRIWHPFDDPDCWKRPELRNALIAGSDHFPVTLDIDL